MTDSDGLAVALRPMQESDLDTLFDQMRDPESVRMAAFTPDDPDNRPWFNGHMAKIAASPEITQRVITCNDEIVGSIGCFVLDGKTQITYWIDRAMWGRGIASRALDMLLDGIERRPIYAGAATDNAGSLRVLEKAGFRVIGTEVSFASARGTEIEETLLRLD